MYMILVPERIENTCFPYYDYSLDVNNYFLLSLQTSSIAGRPLWLVSRAASKRGMSCTKTLFALPENSTASFR